MDGLLAPSVDDATRRRFLAALGAAGLLTAYAAGQTEPGAAEARYPEHQDGPTVVPDQPERIVAVDGRSDLDVLLALRSRPPPPRRSAVTGQRLHGHVLRLPAGSFMGQVGAEAGLRHPQAQLDLVTPDNDFYAEVSAEQIGLIDADVLLYMGDLRESGPSLAGLRAEQNPLWTSSARSAPGRPTTSATTPGVARRGLLSAAVILDELFEHLVEGR